MKEEWKSYLKGYFVGKITTKINCAVKMQLNAFKMLYFGDAYMYFFNLLLNLVDGNFVERLTPASCNAKSPKLSGLHSLFPTTELQDVSQVPFL